MDSAHSRSNSMLGIVFAVLLILNYEPPVRAQGKVTVSGQLVIEDGGPVRHRELSVRIRSSQRRGRTTKRLSTDQEGRFSLSLPSDSSGVLQFSPVTPGRFLGWQRSRPAARVGYPMLEAGNDLDVGKVLWRPWPIAFAGVVVNPEGLPVPNAKLRLRVWRGEGPGHFVTQVSDAQGAFTFRGQPARALQWTLSAQTATARSREVMIRPSQEDRMELRVPVSTLGGLVGRVRTKAPKLPVEIQIRAESSWSPPGRDPHWRTITLDSNGSPGGEFSLDGLLPGDWDIQVLLDGREDRRVEGLLVKPDATARPAALEDLVVGESWTTHRVFVQDASGAKLKDALVAFIPEAISGWRLRSTDAMGIAIAAYPMGEPLGIRVQARGFRDSIVEEPKFPQSVRLTPGVPVTLEFETPLPALTKPSIDTWQLSVVPKPHRSSLPHPTLDLRRPLMSDRVFRPYPAKAGLKRLQLPGLTPGLWSVHLLARRPIGGGNQRFLDLGEFVIPDQRNLLVVPLSFSKEQLLRVFGQ